MKFHKSKNGKYYFFHIYNEWFGLVGIDTFDMKTLKDLTIEEITGKYDFEAIPNQKVFLISNTPSEDFLPWNKLVGFFGKKEVKLGDIEFEGRDNYQFAIGPYWKGRILKSKITVAEIRKLSINDFFKNYEYITKGNLYIFSPKVVKKTRQTRKPVSKK